MRHRLMPQRGSRLVGYSANGLLRLSIAGFLLDVMRRPHDPRYAGKAIPLRNMLIVGSLSFVFPWMYVWRRPRRWQRYPVWSDNMYLSIFWVDMAGNAFGLYNRYANFDLVPHFHGSGALGAVLTRAFAWPAPWAFAGANAIHALLEAQEYATDVVCGTHNVRGAWDSAGDLAAGLLGTFVYIAAASAPRTIMRRPAMSRRRARVQ